MRNLFLLLTLFSCIYQVHSKCYSYKSGKSIYKLAVRQLIPSNDSLNHYESILLNTVEFKKDSTETVANNPSFAFNSISKTVTALATCILIEQEKLSLNDPLQKFFPELPYRNITIRQLLTMKSGLPDINNLIMKYADQKTIISNEQLIRILAWHKPKAEINGHYNHNNLNYILLANIIEQVSGYDYGAFVHTKIFKPLKMINTYNTIHSNIHTAKSSGIKENNFFHPYGAERIHSTRADARILDNALKNGVLGMKIKLDLVLDPIP